MKKEKINVTVVPIILVAISKYGYLLYYQPNARHLSEFLFHLFALLFLVILFQYMQLQRDERSKNELLYKELLHTHRQLKNYMRQAEQITTLQERNRIGREIHDSVGHELTSLIMQLEMALLLVKNNKEKVKLLSLLESSKETAKNCLKETRKAVYELKETDFNLISALNDLVVKVKMQQVTVHLEIDSNLENVDLSDEQSRALYRVCQEAITNVMRHGNDPCLWLSLHVVDCTTVYLHIENKVIPDLNFKDGYGIETMRKRMEQIGGSLVVKICEDKFIVVGIMPIKGV